MRCYITTQPIVDFHNKSIVPVEIRTTFVFLTKSIEFSTVNIIAEYSQFRTERHIFKYFIFKFCCNLSTNKISGFLAPAYLALGIGAQWVPCKHFSLTLSPVTGRLTIVNDQELANQGAFGVTGVKMRGSTPYGSGYWKT